MTKCIIHINQKSYSWPFSELKANPGPLEQEVWSYLNEWFQAASFEVKTSGSTGTPKTITHAKSAIEWSARSTAAALHLGTQTKALCCLPLEKIAGRLMLYRSIICDWELTVRSASGMPFETDDAFDFVALTPFQATQSLKTASTVFNQVDKIILGGAQVLDSLKSALLPYSCAVWETYGMTETVTHIALKQLQPSLQSRFHALQDVSLSTIESGQLIIDAPHLKAPLTTNDIVDLHEDQSFQLLGRKDDAINSGGIKLFPNTLEAKMAHLIDVRFYITKSPDAALGEAVTLVLESSPLEKHAQDELLKRLQSHLAKFEVPRKVLYQSTFTETDTGKIIRKLPS